MEGLMTILGCARVSTDDQTLDIQHAALAQAGCTKVFAEKISGARSDRPQLAKLLKSLGPGDLVVITKLDRLARSTHDLQVTLKSLRAAGADFKVLDNPALDTTTVHGKLLFDIMGAIAEFERGMIVARTSEGRKAAKARGVHMGRPPKLSPHQRREALQRRANGDSLADIARSFGVDPTTIGRMQ
jgi:DNA invertase Pin-like site-specific DNA recombinase